MIIKTLVVGRYNTNCYIVSDENTGECAVIDPGADASDILKYISENRLKCRYVFITHGHPDHTGESVTVSESTGAPICIHRKDVGPEPVSRYGNFKPPEGSIFFQEGNIFRVGDIEFRILETPGHTPGGVTLLADRAMFCGDTLFRGSRGKTTLPGGDIRAELRSLKKLCELPGDYTVYPGHMESTTLERERNYNTYVLEALDSLF